MVKTATKLVKANFKITQMKENQSIVDFIMDDLKNVDLKPLKTDPDFLRYIAELIENDVSKSKKEDEKVDKMNMFEMILKKLFPDIKQDEIALCKNIVEFLLKQKLVKKTKLSKIMYFFLCKKFCSSSE